MEIVHFLAEDIHHANIDLQNIININRNHDWDEEDDFDFNHNTDDLLFA